MITISLCMIVKNEEDILCRCLDSIAPLMDEIIIVDTGSTDKTRELASKYTDQIYDFTWCDDFSAARNFAFSKATMDYIYAPDADEYLDDKNQKRFLILKQAMLPEIEIVQMFYLTPVNFNTVSNCQKELRPKLFKRLRSFVWVDPIHETVRTEPLVYDSDIEIMHLPQHSHSKRDFAIYQKAHQQNQVLSRKVLQMYAKELMKCGDEKDFLAAESIFTDAYLKTFACEYAAILAHIYRVKKESDSFFTICLSHIENDNCSEICQELALYYLEHNDWEHACSWFDKAVFQYAPVLDIEVTGPKSLEPLAKCYEMLGQSANAEQIRTLSTQWKLPEEIL